MPGRTSALHRLALVAATAAAADLVSKALAVALLGERVVPVAGPLSLSLIYNTGSAGGVSLGAYTWLLNVGATAVAMLLAVMVCRAAAAFDRGAPVALGLVVGGALGNLASLVVPPAGVADFLALDFGQGGIVLNFADVAAYVGIALSMRTALRLVAALRIEQRTARHVQPLPARRRIADMAVEIPLVVEGALADAPARTPPAPRGRRAPDDAPAERERRAEM